MAKEPSKRLDPTIIAALIGVGGTIIVALITVFGNRLSAPTPQPTSVANTQVVAPTAVVFTDTIAPTVVPTDTVPAGQPTSTPPPATDTPTATPAPVPLGEDWSQNCISTLWQPYPLIETVPLGNGCLQQPIYFFETQGGGLNFQDDGKNSTSPVFGLFAPLPGTSGSVTVKVSLQELAKADLLMGVYESQDLNANGVLMTIPSGNVNNQKILQMLSFNNYKTVDNTKPISQGDGYTITFNYSPTSVTASVPGIYSFKKVTVSGTPKYIFLGYRKLGPSYTANGTFVSLSINQ